jgi:hypothetical protein
MARLRRLAWPCVTGALLAGCAAAPTRVSTGRPPGAVRLERGTPLGWATKQVATKEPPATLVATDGTVCRVAEERYARTDAGAVVACEWQLAAPAP